MRINLYAILILFFLITFSFISCFAGGSETHTVVKGETALEIALDHNLSIAELQMLNPDINLEMLKIGDNLIVPMEGYNNFQAFLDDYYADFLRVDDLHCYVTADGSVQCLFLAENTGEKPLHNIRFTLKISDIQGQLGEVESSIPLMQIQPGEKLPVYCGIAGNFQEIVHAEYHLNSMTSQDNNLGSFRIEAQTVQTHIFPGGISSTAIINFDTETAQRNMGKKINLLAGAFDAEGNLVGVRSLYGDFFPHFELTVYSVNTPITHMEIFAETYQDGN